MEYSRRKIIETQSTSIGSIATLTCCAGLFIPQTSSVSTELSQSGVEQILERQVKADSKVLAKHFQKFKSNRKPSVDIPRLPHASGNRMLQNLKYFNSMPSMNKTEYLRTTAKFYHPIEKKTHYVATALEDDGWGKRTSMCKEFSAPKNRENSLSSPGHSVWISISRGLEGFVNEIHRHKSDVVNYSSSLRAREENLNDVCFENLPNLPW